MTLRGVALTLASLSLLITAGCAALGVTLFGVGAGVSGSSGVSYTLDSIAYKTFPTSVETLQNATLRALQRMDIELKDIEVQEDQGKESGRKLVAVAGDRTVEIELDRLTAKASRMRVNCKRGIFFKDRATATEIIVQTERTLGE